MKKVLALICFNLGLWGILGFFATLVLGFLSCCIGLSKSVFFVSLIVFALVGLTATIVCVSRKCKNV